VTLKKFVHTWDTSTSQQAHFYAYPSRLYAGEQSKGCPDLGSFMGCVSFGSERQSLVDPELAFSFIKLEYGARRAPAYMVSGIKVCLDCGFANLHVPSAESAVRQAALESRSHLAIVQRTASS
jgi:hypothetical protein